MSTTIFKKKNYSYKEKQIENRLLNLVSSKRFAHSIRTAEYAVFLAKKLGINNIEKLRLAALSHDIAKEFSKERLLHCALLDQGKINPFDIEHPQILHGYAGAWFLKSEFDIYDESILNAVRFHTTGASFLDDLGKIVYCADYLEPGRTFIDENQRSFIDSLDLNALCLWVINATKKHLKQKNLPLAPQTKEMAKSLKQNSDGSENERTKKN